MQLERCLSCDSFEPDARYQDAFREACHALEGRVARGDISCAQQLDTYKKFLSRLAVKDGNENENG